MNKTETITPIKTTLNLVDWAGIPLLRTDVNGTVKVTSDGKKWEVGKERDSSVPSDPGNRVKGWVIEIVGWVRHFGGSTSEKVNLESAAGIMKKAMECRKVSDPHERSRLDTKGEYARYCLPFNPESRR
jgi:hypothetical protein